MKQTSLPLFLSALLLTGLLAGCSSGEERQAKYYARAQALFAEGDYDKAKLEVRNVLQINAEHPQARYLWAQLAEREQNWREMFGNLQMAVDLDPNYIDARIKLGQLYYRSQAYDQALAQADAVLALDANSADGHTLRGSVFYRKGDNATAIAEANTALALQPGHVGAISILTEVYKGEDPELALAVIGEGMSQQSETATLKLLKISVLEQQGDADGVINVYKELIADYPENLFFHYRLVKFLEQQERIDEAEALLRDIVKTTPDNLQLKLWLAEFIANQRNLELAETTVKEFIRNQPDIYELRFALGKIYMALRQYEEAEAVYAEVIALDVDGADSLHARNELVKLQLARGEQESGQRLLDEI
ncbi:MAG: tetratricopeptide repeat protein, partial [Pseudomonadales bacterium]|nr:tetratricopeptide repeat protein [Pseudomonadales bacterium]